MRPGAHDARGPQQVLVGSTLASTSGNIDKTNVNFERELELLVTMTQVQHCVGGASRGQAGRRRDTKLGVGWAPASRGTFR